MNDTTRDIAAAIRREVIPEGAKRLGLVIGIDRYQDARLNLRCARADAEAMRNLMLDPECGLFDTENVTLLADEDATRERIWRALAGLRRKAHKQDSVWIFYAGHGAPEGDDFYWVPHDGDVDDLYSTGLSRRDLNRVLDDLHSERIVAFMDCCHAAAMAAQKHKTRAVMTADAAFSAYTGKGRLIFAASDGREKSVEIADQGRGAFSYFLEKGLRGEADHGAAGVVTADELWQYLKDKVSTAAQDAGNPQTPVRIGEETHDFALSINPLEFGRRKRLAEAIKGMVGVGPDQLTTEEGRICLDLLRRGANTDAEKDLMEEFDSLVEGSLRLSTLRRLIDDVKVLAQPIRQPTMQHVTSPESTVACSSSAAIEVAKGIETICDEQALDEDEAKAVLNTWSTRKKYVLNPLCQHIALKNVRNGTVYKLTVEQLRQQREASTTTKGVAFNPERVCWQCLGATPIDARRLPSLTDEMVEDISRLCPDCRGSGVFLCKICYGSGQQLCSFCDGVGMARIDKGWYSKTDKCSFCKGSGKMLCRTCGTVPSHRCGTCMGSGVVAEFRRVCVNVKSSKTCAVTGAEEFADTKEFTNTKGILLCRIDSDGGAMPALPSELKALGEFDWFRAVLRDNWKANTDDTRGVRARIELSVVPFVLCDCAYNGKTFTLAIVGTNRDVREHFGKCPREPNILKRIWGYMVS